MGQIRLTLPQSVINEIRNEAKQVQLSTSIYVQLALEKRERPITVLRKPERVLEPAPVFDAEKILDEAGVF